MIKKPDFSYFRKKTKKFFACFIFFVRVWVKISLMAVQSQLTTGWSSLLYIIGKVLRFFFFFLFIFSILSKTGTLAGYSKEQIILFFLVFSLLDVVTQIFFRGVYRFRPLIVRGDFDLVLLQPVNSFFRPIFGWTDFFDFLTLIPLSFYFIYYLLSNGFFNPLFFCLFIIFFINSLILSFSFHLFVCSICVLTTEIDHLVMVYRDLTNTARFPTDIYGKNFRFFLTFIIPVAVIFSFPVKVLLGLLNWQTFFFSIFATAFFLFLSLKFWYFSLKKYTSTGS